MGTKITINKHVHSGGNWDGYLQFQLETNPYGWGGWNNTVVLKQYEMSYREFVHSYGPTPSAGTYIVIYLLGGSGISGARQYSVNMAGFGAPTKSVTCPNIAPITIKTTPIIIHLVKAYAPYLSRNFCCGW